MDLALASNLSKFSLSIPVELAEKFNGEKFW